jgi:phage terminase large subunit GpA-like protein
MKDAMLKTIRDLFSRLHTRIDRISVSEWAEQKRILPPSLTSRPGPFHWSVTPYLREIADCLSVHSPVTKVAVMKGARIGFTVGVLENFIGYVIDAEPGPMIYVSAGQGVAESTVELRIDAMIESAGLAGKIFTQSKQKANKKSGNTKSKKEFPGGYLLALGPNTGARLRGFGSRYLLLDEVDDYPHELGAQDNTKGKRALQGDPVELADWRTKEWGLRKKILYGSTPLVEQSSKIKPLFEAGDQRYYFVPCKHCGEMQPLRWRDEKGEYRLKYEKNKAGIPMLETVHYECEKCGGHWKNDDKAIFLEKGEWRPTAEAREPYYRSYHISALYSPLGMYTWEEVILDWERSHDHPEKLKTFFNNVLGEPWVERGESPIWERIALRPHRYQAGSLPENSKALFLTAGVDVQKDSLVVEVVGWGRGMESWSVLWEELPAGVGDTSDIGCEAWKALRVLLGKKYSGLPILRAMIDTGYATDTVYAFCEPFTGVTPIKGASNPSLEDRRNVFQLRIVKEHAVETAFLNTSLIKETFYGFIVKGEPETGPMPDGFCHFPIDYPDKFYKMLASEERITERNRVSGYTRRSWRVKHGYTNHALDARVYAMAGVYVSYGLRSEEKKAEYELMKLPPEDFSMSDFWTEIENMRGGLT